MPVVIEELRADVTAPPPPPAAAPAPAPEPGASDERLLLEAIAIETWAQRRLLAD